MDRYPTTNLEWSYAFDGRFHNFKHRSKPSFVCCSGFIMNTCLNLCTPLCSSSNELVKPILCQICETRSTSSPLIANWLRFCKQTCIAWHILICISVVKVQCKASLGGNLLETGRLVPMVPRRAYNRHAILNNFNPSSSNFWPLQTPVPGLCTFGRKPRRGMIFHTARCPDHG